MGPLRGIFYLAFARERASRSGTRRWPPTSYDAFACHVTAGTVGTW